MKKFKILCFLFLLNLPNSSNAEGISFDINIEGKRVSGLISDTNTIQSAFSRSEQYLENNKEFINTKQSTTIIDKAGFKNALNTLEKKGYIEQYCGFVLTAALLKNDELSSPLVLLNMMTDIPPNNIPLILPFRAEANKEFSLQTADYYTYKYGGKFICVNNVDIAYILSSKPNFYIVPVNSNHEYAINDISYSDANFITIH